MLGAPAFSAELVERIVARVNDRLITKSEFDKRVDLTVKAPQGPKDMNQVRLESLDDLIKEKLVEERAKELSITATDAEVEEALARVKEQYKLTSDAEFDAALGQSGLTRNELKKQLRETITIQKVVGRDVTSRLEITDDMLRLEYERQKEKLYTVPEQARVWEIVIRFPRDDATARENAGSRIAEAQAKIKAGAGFADVVKEYSEGSARERGGDLGIVLKGELLPALDTPSSRAPSRIPGARSHAHLHASLSRDRAEAGGLQALQRRQGRPAQADR